MKEDFKTLKNLKIVKIDQHLFITEVGIKVYLFVSFPIRRNLLLNKNKKKIKNAVHCT